MAEVDTSPCFDWAHDAYVALNDAKLKQQQTDSWTPFVNGTSSLQNMSFTIPPSLLTHASIERYGQVTPPEERSPGGDETKTSSSVQDQDLSNEATWSEEHSNTSTQQQSKDAQSAAQEESAPKRRRTSRQAMANQSAPTPPNNTTANTNPQPPKRKRGRPKSQPQMVEAFTADGFPFQVSSARQSHLEKNRVAAHKCRQRKKEYINSLEGRAREFSSKNKALKENVAMLREEVLSLKNEVLRHAGCSFWAVDEYLARCAGDLLGMEAPSSLHSPSSSTRSPPLSSNALHDSITTPMQSTSDMDDFGGLELLRDFDEADMDELEQMS